ncbi:MAG: hypothetical protein NZO16_00245 [Deltaproteobacteria bacterium]|nr:hypothetical protein [Deltaproteobacteria bacterium]
MNITLLILSLVWVMAVCEDTADEEILALSGYPKIASDLKHEEFYNPEFQDACLNNPDSLPEPVSSSCTLANNLGEVLTADIIQHQKLTEETLKQGKRFWGWGPNKVTEFATVEAITELITPILKDTISIFLMIAPETLIPDLVKLGTPLNVTSKHCYGRHLDLKGFPFKNTCKRTYCISLPLVGCTGIYYRIDFAPPIVYRLPHIQIEAPKTLLHSTIYPGWVLGFDQNISLLLGNNIAKHYLSFKDFILALFLTNRTLIDQNLLPIEIAKISATNRDQLQELLAAETNLRLKTAELGTSQALVSSLGLNVEAPVMKTYRLIQQFRDEFSKRYGETSLLSDPSYAFASEFNNRAAVGALQYVLGAPLSKAIISRLSEELPPNLIPYLYIDGVGLVMSIIGGAASGGLTTISELQRIKEMIDSLKTALDSAQYIQDIAQLADILSNQDLTIDQLAILLFEYYEKYRHMRISKLLDFNIDQIKNSFKSIMNSINSVNFPSGAGAVGFGIYQTINRFCHLDRLPTEHFTAQPAIQDRDVLAFFDAEDILGTLKRLTALNWARYPDMAVLSPDLDLLKILKPYGTSLPLGDFLARLSPETLYVLGEHFNLPEFSRKFLEKTLDFEKSAYLSSRPDECSKVGFAKIDPSDPNSKTVAFYKEALTHIKCAFGERVFKHIKRRKVPFSSEAQRLEVLQTIADSYLLAPQFWKSFVSYQERVDRVFKNPETPSDGEEREASQLPKTFLLETDRIYNRHPRAPIFPERCVTPSEFVEKDSKDVSREGWENPLIENPNERPQNFMLWTLRKCCLYGKGVYFD